MEAKDKDYPKTFDLSDEDIIDRFGMDEDEFEDTEDEIIGYQCLGCGNIQDHQSGFGCDRCLGHCLEPWYG